MNKYFLPEIDYTKFYEVYVGDRKRYATSTAVRFINKDKILVASLFGKKIYLLDISKINEIKILDEIDTPYYVDLMDFKNNIIFTANFPCFGTINGSISIFELNDDKINFKKNIILDKIKSHSCNFLNDNELIICNTDNFKRGCLIFNRTTETYEIFDKFNHFPKDTYITNNSILIVTSSSRPTVNKKNNITNSILYLYNKNYDKLDELEFFGQTDSITLNGENGFITLQGQDSILHFKLINNKLSFIKNIGGFNFPHGIHSFENKIAITNYGDNSVDIYDLEELIKD